MHKYLYYYYHYYTSTLPSWGTDHIIDVSRILGQLLVQVAVEPRDDKVAVVFILHQLLDPADLEPAQTLTVQNTVDHLLQELLVLAERSRQVLNVRLIQFTSVHVQDRIKVLWESPYALHPI